MPSEERVAFLSVVIFQAALWRLDTAPCTAAGT